MLLPLNIEYLVIADKFIIPSYQLLIAFAKCNIGDIVIK